MRLNQVMLAVVSLAGIAVAGYILTIPKSGATFCNINSLFSCDAVLTSSYSHIFGVPVAALGLTWFAGAFGLSLASFKTSVSKRLFLIWAIVGVMGIPPLVYAEYLVGAICLLCTSTHILGIMFLVLAFLYKPSIKEITPKIDK